MIPRVAFSMIVFNLDYVLEAVLESIYPFASQILITEGPVQYFVNRGFTTSVDDTVEIIKSFPDPERKITLIRGQWPEKTEMANAQTPFVRPDTEFAWTVDADEVYKPDDIRMVSGMLSDYDSVGLRSLSFYGSFDHVLTGFEWGAEYTRIQRWTGKGWKRHRGPTIINPESGRPWREHRHLGFEYLAAKGVFLYHYTYVFPRQVRQKAQYMYDFVAPGRCIPDYHNRVYLPWAKGTKEERRAIEAEFRGVHEFLPKRRGSCLPAPFTGQHPPAIVKRLKGLRERLRGELHG